MWELILNYIIITGLYCFFFCFKRTNINPLPIYINPNLPLQFHIQVNKVEAKYITGYLWNLIQYADEGVNIIFNGIIMTKNDVNKYKEI